jgi:L-methionine (R)-S-oxide reductase
MSTHSDLLRQVEELAAIAPNTKTLMQRVADHVHSVMPRYNSVSFRLIDPANPRMLILGPYTGSFTPQLRIPFSQGLCGAAAATEKTVVVNNVVRDSRYLPGSTMVKSEMVVPIFVRGKFSAEIDIQSYFADTFKDPEDHAFVEASAGVIGRFMESHSDQPASPRSTQ